MENNHNDIEWIERYLDRSLSTEEKKEMEKRLAGDPELKNKYVEYRKLIEGIRYAHLQDKVEQLKTLENSLGPVDLDTPSRQVWMHTYGKYLAAAAAVVLFVASYLIFMRPTDPQEVFARYFEPYPNVFEPTVRGSGQDNRRAEAFIAYDRGDYEKAATLFAEQLKLKQEPGLLLLLGNTNLILGRTEEAQNNFLTLIKDFDELDGQAKWYLGLSYLKQGQTEKARLILQELGEPEVTYSKKANELLHEVR